MSVLTSRRSNGRGKLLFVDTTKPSRSAQQARARELERIARLSARERAVLALRLGRRARAWMERARQAGSAP